jgi:hypothetical protein
VTSTVTWDGGDFSAIQMLTLSCREQGVPAATVTKDWVLRIKTAGGYQEVPPGWSVAVDDAGIITIHLPAEPS